MIKLKSFIKPAIIVVVTLVVAFWGTVFALGLDITNLPQQIKMVRKICSIDTRVRHDAIYSSNNSATDVLANAYISNLNDDYAQYFTVEDYTAKKNEFQGLNTKSMGVTITIENNQSYVRIVYVNTASPAKKAGLKAGDYIISINGTLVKGKSPDEVSQLVSGKDGDIVKLVIKRDNKKQNISVKLGDYVTDSVVSRMIGKVGYIQIVTFNEATVEQFDKAYAKLKKKGATALVFDLRNNGGGTVDSCAKILDKICPKGDLIRMKYKNGTIKTDYSSDESEIKMPMSVIVNQYSASAAEIFAMNIRDFSKGKLVGQKTFGKGIAQTTYGLIDGSAIKFTTSQVVDKNGNSYHKKGLTPDILVKLTKQQQKYFYTLSDDEDPQLQAALKAVS